MKPVRPISRPFLRFGTLTAGSRRAPRSVILLAFAVTLFGSATGAAAAAPFCASEAAATPAAIPAAAIPAAELGGTLPGSGAPVAPTAAPPLIQPLPPGKALHFLAGMAGGLLAAAAVESLQNPQLIGSYPLYLPAVALSTATVAGIGKEVLDSTGFGGAEFSDILITMAGGLTAAATVAYAERLFPATPEGKTNGATLFAATGALLAIPVVIGLIHEIVRSAQRHATAREAPIGARK